MSQSELQSAPEKYIEIEKVVAEKNPALAKWLPGFVMRYIKRIIHQDEINEAMRLHGDKEGLPFVRAGLDFLNTTVKTVGLENIPKEGGVILASNHPLGGLDGIAFMKAVGEVREDQQFLVNDILLNIKNLEPLFIPVNKVGANPRKALQVIEDTYARDIAILVFPSGMVSRRLADGIGDLTWQKSFIAKAKKYKKDIIPVHIDGKNSSWFYNLSYWRSKLGIKANLEMFYLADEMFKQRGKTITITFGEPVSWQSFDNSKSLVEWAEYMRSLTYALPKKK
ncbi:1-acyl-sn-glycerol-3-phosphate acyltransferase [Croceimicrobium hydrocarbonivorans]|uniref:1-acyl-sn-glycerol-3-phosphate acyltransferase n=1 Tax=Croceimicrobium hydrocarbonivorans TaxID=2761580 RepID=A0A7H0VGM6_9FLAO|nr:1-acyl-sn-glycerol-3-phosphate acyltransferase [Croceimicrobium hydrocarbonivorans]QNR24874.1 1-acyl-sn-glycerol-3-phosphate acyltransferase [Croceimicrobium hydrocarbonivorans]